MSHGWLSVTVSPLPTSLAGSDDAIGAELVEGPQLVVLAPTPPVRDGLKERPELRGGHVDSAFLRHSGSLRLRFATARRMSRL